MSPRLIAALLRFLPANLSQSPDNPLQTDRLPKDLSLVGLDYPVYQDAPEAARQSAVLLIFVAALSAPVLSWVAHLLPFPYLHGGINTLGLLIAAALVVFGVLGRWSPVLACVTAAAVLPILGLLVKDIPFALAAAMVALAGTAVLADSLVRSYVFLKTAAPVAPDCGLPIRRACQSRWTAFFRPLRGTELWPLGFILLPIAAWLILKPVAQHRGFGDFWSAAWIFLRLAALGIVWSIIHESLIAPVYARRPYSVWARFKALGRAIVEWCTYNRLHTWGVGVHQDRSGSCATRRQLLIGTLVAWACVWVGLQLERPAESQHFLEAILQGEFLRHIQHRSYEEMRQNTFEQNQQLLSPRPLEQTLPEMSQSELEQISRLPPAEAEEFLQEKKASAAADSVAAERSKAEDEANRKVGELLWEFCIKLGNVAIQVLVPSLATLVVVFGLLFGIAAPALAGVEAQLGSAPRRRILATENWEMVVSRIRGSADPIEKKSIFLGANSRDDTPVLAPRAIFGEHCHILGDSGSGKTSIGIAPLIAQLMRSGDCSIVLVDLKADDQFLFELLRREAAKLNKAKKKRKPDGPGYRFRWFTTVLERSSFAFNPLTQRAMPQLGPDQRADIVTAALGLQYGSDYGRKFYADANYDVLNYAFREHPNVQSFAELELILDGADRFPLPEKTREAGTHVRSSVRRLARCRALNACPSQGTPESVLEHAIDLSDLFTHPQALYIALPPAAGISSTAEIARIFMYSLMAAAQAHPKPRKQVFLVVDEFQRIVSKNVELFLQQARSMGIGCIFSNQSLADLEAVGSDLAPAVRANTRFRQVFGAGNQADIDDLIRSSGETIYAMHAWQYAASMFSWVLRSLNVTEHRAPRLSINDILLATDAPGRNIANIRRGEGYAQFGGMPFIMDSVYHLPRRKYRKLVRFEWPAQDERTLQASITDATVQPVIAGPIILPPETLPPPGPPARRDETAEEPAADTATGIHSDYLDEVFDQMEEEQIAHHQKRKAAQRKQSQPPLNP